jgi:ABC-type branched-subunit amino acid transport system ATPase component
VIVLNFGKVLAIGEPEEIVHKKEVLQAYIGKKEITELVS